MKQIDAYARTVQAVGGYACPPPGIFARGWSSSIKAAARQLIDVSLRKYLRVYPTGQQTITWVRMEDVIAYTIESNTHWNIV